MYRNKLRNTSLFRSLRTIPFATLLFAVLIKPVGAQTRDGGNQNIREMSLEEVLAITEKENFQIRMAKADIDRRRSQYRQTNAVFLPQLSIEETGVSTNDPLSVFGFLLKQEIVTQADFNPADLNDPDVTENFATKFSVRQPVLNPDMMYARGATKNRLKAARAQLEGTFHHARFQVKDAYYRLQLLQEQLNVIEKSLETARENERQAGNFFEQDIISKADYLAANVRLLELQSRLSRVKNQMETARDNLRYLLNMEEKVTIVPTDSLQVQPLVEKMEAEESTNSELQALKYQISAAEQMLKSAKFSFMPSLNIFGSYEFNDDVLLGTGGENYIVGATLKWNLFSGYNKIGKVSESRAQLKKAELAYESKRFRNRLDIKEAKRSIEHAKTQLELARSSVEQAAEDLRIRRNRYEEGLEKTTDLLQAETKLSQSRFQQLTAMYKYNIGVATLELLLEQEVSY